MKGDEFGSFGAIIYRIAGNKWEQIKNIGWKKRLLFDKEKEIVFKAPAELFKNKPGRYVLALFRNSGGVRISQIVMEKEQTSSATPSNEDFLRQKAMSDGNTISPLPQRRHEYVEGTGDSLKLDYFPMADASGTAGCWCQYNSFCRKYRSVATTSDDQYSQCGKTGGKNIIFFSGAK